MGVPTPVAVAKRLSGAIVFAFAALMTCAGVARAAENTDPSSSDYSGKVRWLLVACPPGHDCIERHSYTTATACLMDAAGDAMIRWPAGTRMTCLKRTRLP